MIDMGLLKQRIIEIFQEIENLDALVKRFWLIVRLKDSNWSVCWTSSSYWGIELLSGLKGSSISLLGAAITTKEEYVNFVANELINNVKDN